MHISFIVAIDENNGMGKHNHLPWHLPADFKMFKASTSGHCILMGRKTFESLGKALPNRTNIVVSTQPEYQADGAIVLHSIVEGIEIAKKQNEEELFVIGGAEIFKQVFPLADRFYLTRVHSTFDADTFFPVFEASEWKILRSERYEPDEKNKWPFTFYLMERKQNQVELPLL